MSTNKTTLAAGIVLVLTLAIVIYGLATDNFLLAIRLALVPTAILLFFLSFEQKKIAFFALLIVNYFIPVREHYPIEFATGLIMDSLIVLNLIVILVSRHNRKATMKHVSKDVVIVMSVWLAYCALEVLNPHMSVFKAWLAGIRGMALYPLMILIITQTMVESVKEVKQVLVVWSILIIISVLKAIYQKYVGWTPGDEKFLFEDGGETTHIIYYGTRYFSIFSDASNFGGSMGLALVVFGIAGLHVDSLPFKLYLWIIAGLAAYGMFISGTRSALAVPIAGLLLYLLLIKDFKRMFIVSGALAGALALLMFTDIGGSSAAIRRARTFFQATEDQSYQIRVSNRQQLKELMKALPIGNSLSMSAGRAHKYGDYSYITMIPTDSWFVQLWVETGYVGIVIYFSMMIYLFVKAGILVFFKLKDAQIKGLTAALLSGVSGLFVMSSNSEVFSQFPNGILVYCCFGMIYLAPMFEGQLKKKDGIADNGQLQRR